MWAFAETTAFHDFDRACHSVTFGPKNPPSAGSRSNSEGLPHDLEASDLISRRGGRLASHCPASFSVAGLPMQACMEAPPRAVSVGGVWSCRVSVDGRKRVVASRFSAIRHRFGLVSDCNNRTTTCLMFREPLTIHPPIPSESNFPVRFGWNHISSYAGAIT